MEIFFFLHVKDICKKSWNMSKLFMECPHSSRKCLKRLNLFNLIFYCFKAFWPTPNFQKKKKKKKKSINGHILGVYNPTHLQQLQKKFFF